MSIHQHLHYHHLHSPYFPNGPLVINGYHQYSFKVKSSPLFSPICYFIIVTLQPTDCHISDIWFDNIWIISILDIDLIIVGNTYLTGWDHIKFYKNNSTLSLSITYIAYIYLLDTRLAWEYMLTLKAFKSDVSHLHLIEIVDSD